MTSHAAHHLLAIYALGASAPIIDAAYQTHVEFQRPAIPSPGVITIKNFQDFLGQQECVSNHTCLPITSPSEPYRYYSAYVDFFTVILRKDGAAATLEDYVFSQKANFDPAREADRKSPPQFLCRLVDGLFHPLIHVGYGLEFGLPGTLAEGVH